MQTTLLPLSSTCVFPVCVSTPSNTQAVINFILYCLWLTPANLELLQKKISFQVLRCGGKNESEEETKSTSFIEDKSKKQGITS